MCILSCYCKIIFPVSDGLFRDNKRAYFFFAIELIIVNLFFKQTLKMEETFSTNWIFSDTDQFLVFTADFSMNHSGSIICTTSSLLLLFSWFEWLERSYIKKKKKKKNIYIYIYIHIYSQFFIIADFGYLGKETINKAENVIMKKNLPTGVFMAA